VNDNGDAAASRRTRPVKLLRHVGRQAAWLGAAAGVVAAGAAVGLAAERYAGGRSLRRNDPLGREPFGELRGEPRWVRAEDGVRLWVETEEPLNQRQPGAPDVTVVFLAGFMLNMDEWHFQHRDLRDVGRLVFFDHRSHGRSERGPKETSTIEQLARDLKRVLDEVAPQGPIVLVGHSLGGMALMAFADAYPEEIGSRVAGAGLLCTSPGRLAEITLGMPAALVRLIRPHTPRMVDSLARRRDLVEYGRRAGSDLAYVFTKRLAFGSKKVSPAVARFANHMLAQTPVDVFAEFFPEFDRHDKEAALPVLQRCPTLIMAGEDDLVTPAEHSRAMAAVLSDAELVVLEDCGHLIQLEYPDVVNDAIRRLVDRALRSGRAGAGRET
jgi:pimeloyl-ACP methyl ester carboxylesterase